MNHGQWVKYAFRMGLLSLGAVALATPARAVVIEPNGVQVPQPLTQDLAPEVISCCGVQPDGSNMSLEALFLSRGEALHWLNDAATEPSYFSPLCGFRGSLILRGGGCRVDFGWYNVDLDNPNPPLPQEIFPLVTIADVNAWFTNNSYPPNLENAFHPAVGEPPIEGALIANLRDNPNYRGGLIGLATIGNDIGEPPQCTQTHYSEARLNQMSVYGAPWIMALVYRSTLTPNAFYIAFEDLPTAPDNFDLPTSRGYTNDGDFNDFVYFVEGVTCEGGGQPCLVTAEGACGYGLTECLPDGSLVCVPQLEPTSESCDNIDNDCNGLVDDGEGLCPENMVCDKGVCRPNCSGGEFPCESDLVCNDVGLCVDPACLDVTCEAGQICIGGECVGGCSNVACPWGQVCQLGRCVDPCASRECGGNMVCEGGVCVESCHCRMCGPGLTCDYATGNCVPPGCEAEGGVVCADNEVCLTGADGHGQCVNKCTNVLCPGGAECDPATGMCNDPIGGAPMDEPWELTRLPDGGLLRTWPDGTLEYVEVDDNGDLQVIGEADPDAGGILIDVDGGSSGAGSTDIPAADGCSCRVTSSSEARVAALSLLLLGLGLGRWRRGSRRRRIETGF